MLCAFVKRHGLERASHVPSRFIQRLRPDDPREAAPKLLQGGLLLALAIQAGRLLWIAFAPAELPAPPVVATTPRPAAAPALAGHGDPFHPRARDASQATGYTLLGVRVVAGGGSAILAHDGRQTSYATGDEVAAGVTLAAVAADHVILRAGGRDQRIALAPPAASGLPAAHALPVGAPPEQKQAGPDSVAVDPKALLTGTGLRPQRDAGRITGYTIVPRGNEALLQRAGLQAGDVLLAVDGKPLDPGELDDLKRDPGATATLTVRRGDQTRTLKLQAPQ